MDTVTLQVDSLCVSFPTRRGPLQAVRDVSFLMKAGKTVGVVGESGCGKSAMALALMRLHSAAVKQEGSIVFNGQEIMQLPVNSKEMNRLRGGGMAMIFQEPSRALFPMKTVGAHLLECIRLHGERDKKKATGIAIELLRQVGISDPERRMADYPHQFSGGMAQRVMIAMALVGQPKLLIADEATTALDVTIQAQVLRLLKDIQAQNHMSILFISHDMGVIAQMADTVMVMYLGRVVEHAPVRKIFSEPLHPYTQALIGSIPPIDHKAERLDTIEGIVPQAIGKLEGCGFASRCKKAIAGLCDKQVPPCVDLGGHQVMCHLYQKEGKEQ